jgi:hypothetical protein
VAAGHQNVGCNPEIAPSFLFKNKECKSIVLELNELLRKRKSMNGNGWNAESTLNSSKNQFHVNTLNAQSDLLASTAAHTNSGSPSLVPTTASNTNCSNAKSTSLKFDSNTNNCLNVKSPSTLPTIGVSVNGLNIVSPSANFNFLHAHELYIKCGIRGKYTWHQMWIGFH